MAHEFSIRIANDLGEIAGVSRVIHAFLKPHAVPEETEHAVGVAFEEMLSNTIKYGYEDDARHDIELSVSVEAEHILLRIEDDAHAFDPLDAAAPDMDAPFEERPVGGLGIVLVRGLSESMEYERVDGKNVLRIRIRKGSPSSVAPQA